MVRAPTIDKNGMKKGAWNEEEDNKLRAYVTRYGHWNWRELPKFAGVSRCGKSCRLRWVNYLQPNRKRGNYTQEEDDLIIKLHKQLGNKWSAIAAKLPGRSDNDIKNHWHTRLKKGANPNSNVKTLGNEYSGGSEFEPNWNEERSSSSLPTGSNEYQQDIVVTSEFKIHEERHESTSDAHSSAGSSCTSSSADQLSSLSSNSSKFDRILDNRCAALGSFEDNIDSFGRESFITDADISSITDEYYYMVNHFSSPPASPPLTDEEFLWSYENDGFVL